MISYLQGLVVEKLPTKLILDVNGIGYELNITVPCYENLVAIGEKVTVLTYLHVREDILQLYGFKSAFERELFLQLLSIPGIGPRKAQVILSSVAAENLQRYIVDENLDALTSLSGVGKKTAQRLILDLKDKLKPFAIANDKFAPSAFVAPEMRDLVNEALKALVSLGFNKNSAQATINEIVQQRGKDLTLEELIKQALHSL